MDNVTEPESAAASDTCVLVVNAVVPPLLAVTDPSVTVTLPVVLPTITNSSW